MSNNKKLEKDLQNTIEGMYDALINAEGSNRFERIKGVLKDLKPDIEDMNKLNITKISERLRDSSDALFYDLMRFLENEGVLNKKKGDKYHGMMMCHYFDGSLKEFVRDYFRETEGGSCSGDKESFALKQMEKYLRTGEHQELSEKYTADMFPEKKLPDSTDADKDTYWSSTSLKDTEELTMVYYKYLKLTGFLKNKKTLEAAYEKIIELEELYDVEVMNDDTEGDTNENQ